MGSGVGEWVSIGFAERRVLADWRGKNGFVRADLYPLPKPLPRGAVEGLPWGARWLGWSCILAVNGVGLVEMDFGMV
jgi:hypothetical protein